jgi:CBS domain-containing protein
VQVRDFCSRDVVTVEPLASLREASLLMRNRHVGTLVVVDRTSGVPRPVGIVTDRDIVVAVVAVPGVQPKGIRVASAKLRNAGRST